MGQSPSERDRQADERDRVADERDRRADQRDREADERDRQARGRNETSAEESEEDGAGGFYGGARFGIDLGARETNPREVPEPEDDSTSTGDPGRSLTQRLADAADDRERAGTPRERETPPSE